MIKVRVKAGMPEGFFVFYGAPRDVGKRYFASRGGGLGDSFEIHDVSAFSVNSMECVDDRYEVEDGKLVEKRKKPGPKPKVDVEGQ